MFMRWIAVERSAFKSTSAVIFFFCSWTVGKMRDYNVPGINQQIVSVRAQLDGEVSEERPAAAIHFCIFFGGLFALLILHGIPVPAGVADKGLLHKCDRTNPFFRPPNSQGVEEKGGGGR